MIASIPLYASIKTSVGNERNYLRKYELTLIHKNDYQGIIQKRVQNKFKSLQVSYPLKANTDNNFKELFIKTSKR
jgi:hypothetical protein